MGNIDKENNHTAQELFNIYKERICSFCSNKNNDDCNIHIVGGSNIICENYRKGIII